MQWFAAMPQTLPGWISLVVVVLSAGFAGSLAATLFTAARHRRSIDRRDINMVVIFNSVMLIAGLVYVLAEPR